MFGKILGFVFAVILFFGFYAAEIQKIREQAEDGTLKTGNVIGHVSIVAGITCICFGIFGPFVSPNYPFIIGLVLVIGGNIVPAFFRHR